MDRDRNRKRIRVVKVDLRKPISIYPESQKRRVRNIEGEYSERNKNRFFLT